MLFRSHVVVQLFITQFDDAVLSGFTLTNKINNFLFAFGTGFGVALVTIVGQNLAVNNSLRAKNSVKISAIISTILIGILLVFFFIFQEQIIRIFTNDSDEIYHTKNAMYFITTTAIPWIFIQLPIGVFSAAKKPIYNVILSFARLFIIRVPLLFILINFTNLDEYAIWVSMSISNILTAVLAAILYYRVKWDKTIEDMNKINLSTT